MEAIKDDASKRRISSSSERGNANATWAREIAPKGDGFLIAVDTASRVIGGVDDKQETALFAVCQVAIMLNKLKADYQTMWYGEKRRDQ